MIVIPRSLPILAQLAGCSGILARQRVFAFLTTQYHSHPPNTRPLQTVIYGADGKIVQDKEEEEEEHDSSSSDDDDLPLHVLYGIQAEVDAATLSRIACAYAPPPHQHIALEDVHQAILVAVQVDHIDIALSLVAASPSNKRSNNQQQQQLLQVLVPVPLEQPSKEFENIKGMEQHILAQIRRLDERATEGMKTTSKEPVASLSQQQSILSEELTQAPTMDVLYAVDWWTTVPPLKTFLREECESLQKLLNTGNDFQVDLQTLARQQLQNTSCIMQPVQVASIGTSGVWLKAAVLPTNNNNNDNNKQTIMDVPIQFLDGKEATTADDLRESVLTLVESVENIPLEEPKKEAEQVAAASAKKEETAAMEAKEVEEPSSEAPKEKMEEPAPKETLSKEERIAQARQQPQSPETEAALAAKYAAIEDLGERAYRILVDLGMI